MKIKKENVIDACCKLLLGGEKEEAKEAIQHANNKGVDITFSEVVRESHKRLKQDVL